MFEKLRAHTLYAKQSKCDFFKNEIHYLGHVISYEGIKMDKDKVDAILRWPHPTTVEELQIFLGMAGFYRKYVRDYAKISVPMTNQLKEQGKSFNWGEAQEWSFMKLKVALATTPILAVVDPLKPYVVETDASDKAIGAVLLQEGRPIAFESKKLDRAQQNYSTYERELYAIIYALKKWRHYLYGAKFEVVFDHESIKWFASQSDLKGRKARWAEILQDYDYKLRYCQGRYNVVADALSHMPQINSLAFTKIKSEFLESLRGKCAHDQSYEKVWNVVSLRDPIHSELSSTQGSTLVNEAEHNRWKHFSIDDGYLLHKGRVCVPRDIDTRRQILNECHDSPSARHPGIRKTYALVRRQFYWPGCHKDVEEYVQSMPKMPGQQGRTPEIRRVAATIRDSTWQVGEYLYGFYSGVTKYKSWP